MCRKLLLLISIAFVVSLAGSASAAAEWWVGYTSSDWDDQFNWHDQGVLGIVPDSTTGVNFVNSGTPDINFPIVIAAGDNAVCAGLWAYAGETNEVAAPDCLLTMTGGTFTIHGGITLGCMFADADATFAISGGEVNAVEQGLIIGTYANTSATGAGVVNMTAPGGTFSVETVSIPIQYGLGGKGIFNLNAGTINIGDGGLVMSAEGSMDITAGTMIIAGDRMIEIGDYAKAGWITAHGGAVARAYPRAVYAPDTNKTTVTGYTPFANTAWAPSHLGTLPIVDNIISWAIGDSAEKHTIYFGTSWSDVNASATPVIVEQDANTYTPALELGQKYFWRIDEVKVSAPAQTWTGDIWSFLVEETVLIDDMESYDETTNLIHLIWKDYRDVTNTSASYVELGLADRTPDPDPVHGGSQSMRFRYFNNAGQPVPNLLFSEARRDYSIGQTWLAGGLEALDLWFIGDAGNPIEPMYVALGDGSNVEVQVNPDPNAVLATEWTTFSVDLTAFSIVDVNAVKEVYVGVGVRGNTTTEGGMGGLYFDDFELFESRCLNPPEHDGDDNCKVDLRDYAGFSGDWLTTGIWP